MGGYRLDASGNLGVQFLLAGQFANGVDALAVVTVSFHGAAEDAVCFDEVVFFDKTVVGFDAATQVVFDKEPHVGPGQQIGGGFFEFCSL